MNVEKVVRKSYYLSKEAYNLLKNGKKKYGVSMAEAARSSIVAMYRYPSAVKNLNYICVNEHYFCFSESEAGEFLLLDELHTYYNKKAPKRFLPRKTNSVYSRNLILDFAIKRYYKNLSCIII